MTDGAHEDERSVAPEKASDLLLQSAEPFDRACLIVREMEARLDALLTEDAAAIQTIAGNLRRVCKKMHRNLDPGNDAHSILIDLINHANTLAQQIEGAARGNH